MEDLSDCVVADPHPSFLSLVLHEEAVVGSIPIAVEAIGIIQDAKLPFEQQGNAGGSLNFFADQQKGCNNITSKRHSCHPPCLFGVSAEVPLDVTENVSDARDENVADTDDVPKSRAPPARKLGFKGKRANKKFGRGFKRGGKQKACRTSLLLETEHVPAIVDLPENHLLVNDAPNIALAPRSRSSKCKVTKIQLIEQLGQATRQLNLETTEKGIALSDIRSITKKLTKSKEVVGQLRDCLKDARTEIRSKDKRHRMEVSTLITSVAETANDLRTENERTLIKVAATTNDLAEKCESIQNRHKCTLTAVSKKAESKLRASDRSHKRTLTAVSKKAESKLRASDCSHQLELIKLTKVMIAKAESHVLDLEKKDTEMKVRYAWQCD